MQTRYLARQLQLYYIRYIGSGRLVAGHRVVNHAWLWDPKELAVISISFAWSIMSLQLLYIYIVYICSIANKGLGSNPIWYFFHVLPIPFCLFIILFSSFYGVYFAGEKRNKVRKRAHLITPQLIIWCIGPVKKNEREREREREREMVTNK